VDRLAGGQALNIVLTEDLVGYIDPPRGGDERDVERRKPGLLILDVTLHYGIRSLDYGRFAVTPEFVLRVKFHACQ
jgi:hypothetical protein